MPYDPHTRLLADWPAVRQLQDVVFLGGAGGFSGATLWRIEPDRGPLCLRCWPREHPNQQRLEFIQAVLWHVVQEGFTRLPLPLETRTHGGYIRHEGQFYQLEPWLAGRADYRASPSSEKLKAALAALAEFHLAAASFPLPENQPAASPGIADRLRQLESWRGGKLVALRQAIGKRREPELERRAERLLPLFERAAAGVELQLRRAARLRVPLQPCIRDIWHDHVLYLGERVNGFVDFGALRTESVAADLARLIGSLAQDNVGDRRLAIAEYCNHRPLNSGETELLTAFDASGVLMSGMSWLEWIYLENREFNIESSVLSRIDENLGRLEYLAMGSRP